MQILLLGAVCPKYQNTHRKLGIVFEVVLGVVFEVVLEVLLDVVLEVILGVVLEVGLKDQDLTDISSIITELLKRLRPNAVPLVDAFDHHDMVLSSALGSYDGRVYERMYESALKAPLNKTQVHESYHNFLEPLMKSKL
ncbi:hypothetical protein ISCGN_011250 [Ixodes scapularis]